MWTNKYVANESYEFGSYQRSKFRGYNLFYQFEYRDVTIDVTTQNRIIRDHYMERLLEQGIITKETYNVYMVELDKKIDDMMSFVNDYNETVYTYIHYLRLNHLSMESIEALKQLRIRKIKEKLIAIQEKSMDIKDFTIDQSDIYRTMLNSKQSIVVIPESYEDLPSVLDVIRKYLMMKKKVYLLFKELNHYDLATRQDLQCILEHGTYKDVAEAIANKQMELLIDHSKYYGIHFNEISFNRELYKAIEEDDVFVHGFGEYTLLAIKDLNVNSIIEANISSFYGKCVTNIHTDDSKVIIYVPANFNIYDFVPIVEKSKLTYFHLSALCKSFGAGIYQLSIADLYEKYPGYFINIYTNQSNQDQKAMYRLMKPTAPFEDFNTYYINKQQCIRDFIRSKNPELKYISKYYDLFDLSPIAFQPEPDTFQKNVLVDGIVLNKAKQSKIILSDGEKALSPRMVIEDEIEDKGLHFISNFLFFLTPKLSALYNRVRKNRPHEHIDFETGHLGFKNFIKEGRRVKTFPLYNKPCIYMREDGTFSFTNYQLGAGKIKIDELVIDWKEEDINVFDDREVIIYTPQLANDYSNEDHLHYSLDVGKDRLNIVIVNEEIIAIREGDVSLPSIGVVLSLSGKIADTFLKTLSLRSLEDDYYTCHHLSYQLDLDPPISISREEWNAIDWAFGGGLTIIKDNINIFEDQSRAHKYLEAEGWMNPLSKQTQESSIHKMERHPRTGIGLTMDDRLFILVYSGRTKTSLGVNYDEMAKIAMKEIGSIKFMMNLDGGASALLGMVLDKELMELSYPAASNNTCTGMARQLNSMLVIQV
ncbi:phosphodiester glycosidase family protein [Vallitalea okinawensis]|uniref:phosphodiester glycosidase family protein n=1 Tax=Vallitalea okinawensis TaxID=2078660 RepID=UPI0013007705|nr:phosphodiester glycosidase family protein [Vallitalea okinawensis]